MTVQQLKNTSFTILAENLDNPKGLTFAPDGSLYVAEAGIGGDGSICSFSKRSGESQLR